MLAIQRSCGAVAQVAESGREGRERRRAPAVPQHGDSDLREGRARGQGACGHRAEEGGAVSGKGPDQRGDLS